MTFEQMCNYIVKHRAVLEATEMDPAVYTLEGIGKQLTACKEADFETADIAFAFYDKEKKEAKLTFIPISVDNGLNILQRLVDAAQNQSGWRNNRT